MRSGPAVRVQFFEGVYLFLPLGETESRASGARSIRERARTAPSPEIRDFDFSQRERFCPHKRPETRYTYS